MALLNPDAPSGFRPSSELPSLLVPDDVSRTRQVWTRDEWKVIDRAIGLLKARRIRTEMFCEEDHCHGRTIEAARLSGRAIRLRCDCTDRMFTRDL